MNISGEEVDFAYGSHHPKRSGFSRYRQGLKNAIPVRCIKTPDDQLPMETNGFFNYITFGWLTPYMWKLFRKGIKATSNKKITAEESAEVGVHRMERFWQEELKLKGEKDASFATAMLKSFKTRLIIGAISSLLFAFLSLANPILVIRFFLTYLSEEEVTVKSGIVYAVLLGLIILVRGLTGGFFWMLNYEAAARIKYGSLALVYRKVLQLKSMGDKTVGDVVNFIGNDGQRIWDGIIMGPFIIGGPMVMVMSCVYSIVYLGAWALVGWFIIIGFYPFAMVLAQLSQKYRERSISVTDRRVGLMTELLTNIKLIKMYAWEKGFGQKVTDLRAEEKSILEKSVFVVSVNMGSSMMVPVFASCLTFVVYVASGNNLTATQAFTFLSLLNAMQASLATIPFALKALSELVVTTRRLKEILMMDEVTQNTKPVVGSSSLLEFKNVTCMWDNGRSKGDSNGLNGKVQPKTTDSGVKEEEQTLKDHHDTDDHGQIFVGPALKNVSFVLQKGQLIGVCGHVGSGKSSLINAILGRLDVSSGTIAVSGRVAYVSQQAWIMNDSVRENIVFGSDFEEDRYKQVVEACALSDDFNSFPLGDQTEVGERGVTLSGGQKQRISLARAAYSRCDLFLLDDPFSAVDVHVGQHIFQFCIRGLLRSSTVLLVTHHVQHLESCDEILVMKDGSVVEQGSHQQLLETGGEYANLLTIYTRKGKPSEGAVRPETNSDGREASDSVEPETGSSGEGLMVDSGETSQVLDGSPNNMWENGVKSQRSLENEEKWKLIQEEAGESGALPLSVVTQYVKAMGGNLILILVFVCFSMPVVGVTLAGWFLSYWLEQGGGSSVVTVGNVTVPSMRVLDHPDKEKYLIIYAMFIPTLIITMVLRSFFLVKATFNASCHLHDSGLRRTLQCPMSFFDSMPVGRIINRFSTDLDEIDTRLPMHSEIFLNNILQVLAALAMIAYASPWFLIAIVPFGALFFFLMIVFHTCIRELKSLDNVSRSPVISHMAMSIQGLVTIQAYQKTGQFFKRHCELLNTNNVAVFLFYAANRWLALRLDIVSAAVAFTTGLLIILTFDHMNPALAGLALSYAVQMSGLFQFTARLAVETEARFTSVQRILEYSNLNVQETSKAPESPEKLQDWPKGGAITFTNVKLRYREQLPLALKGISFHVDQCQHIGIVGRSGAGKSSLAVALFRLVELESGLITIDGVDISKIALDTLRTKLAIIPQDPVLFSGTVRYNLDPFQEFPDDAIWQALSKCNVVQMVKSLEQQLDSMVVENGENFSVGERQLLCMARALLRNTKILVMDEATAAIDTETDALIQRTLKEAFRECTILSVAHRLSTVLQCDQILVMDSGMIKEMNTPTNLMADQSSLFKRMLETSERHQKVL